jgi:uncharacterized protein (TIGR03083 family)
MSDQVIQSEFVANTRQAREEWDRLIRGVSREEMQRPGFCGDWSLKDILAHIAWYEREMVDMLSARVFAGSDYWDLPTDERNAVIFQENRDRGLDEVLEESRAVFGELLSQLELLTDEDLNDPAQFPGMPLEWAPWQILASNTYEHYTDHARQAKEWLKAG